MVAPAFASLESSVAQAGISMLANARLTDGAVVFDAVLDRDVYPLGDFGGSVDTRHYMVLLQDDYDALADGATIEYDPASYTAAWIAAQPRTSFTLDKIESRDGNLVKVWLQ